MKIAARSSVTLFVPVALLVSFLTVARGAGNPSVPTVFRSIEPQVAMSTVPAYLPTWLPPTDGLRTGNGLAAGLFVPANRTSYNVTIYTDGLHPGPHCTQCGLLFVTGDKQAMQAHAWTRPVRLNPSTWGYITDPGPAGVYWGSCCHTYIQWDRAVVNGGMYTEYHYQIGGAGRWTDAQLVRMAQSVVLVTPH